MIFQLIFLSIIGMLAWFILCLLIVKFLGASKDSPFYVIIGFFIISGPIGWSIFLIIIVYDLVDKISQKKQK
jgi:hypothetical protein